MSVTLSQFEQIDGLLSSLLRAGPFETCADPRGYIRTSNRLQDACVDAMGLDWTNDFASAEEAAAAVVTMALTQRNFVADDARSCWLCDNAATHSGAHFGHYVPLCDGCTAAKEAA